MYKELKKAIIDFMFENSTDFQLNNNTVQKFRPYIYDHNGDYLIGGENICELINMVYKLLKY